MLFVPCNNVTFFYNWNGAHNLCFFGRASQPAPRGIWVCALRVSSSWSSILCFSNKADSRRLLLVDIRGWPQGLAWGRQFRTVWLFLQRVKSGSQCFWATETLFDTFFGTFLFLLCKVGRVYIWITLTKKTKYAWFFHIVSHFLLIPKLLLPERN